MSYQILAFFFVVFVSYILSAIPFAKEISYILLNGVIFFVIFYLVKRMIELA